MNEKTVAIILAGGTGERMNNEMPKQFLEIASRPVIIHTCKAFEKNESISDMIIVCNEKYIEHLQSLIKQNSIQKVYKIVPGGKTRQESSFLGIKACPPDTGFVLIHDAVRPFAGRSIIEDVLMAAKEKGAAAPVISTEDTIIVKDGDFITEIPDRNTLKRIQTPQGFQYETMLKAHEWALENNITDSTDDCGLVLAMGPKVKWVEGSRENIKITNAADLFLAENLVPMRDRN
jgi:2-C-methyl-D-erythritol 4-phosphate cytidylyltransferase